MSDDINPDADGVFRGPSDVVVKGGLYLGKPVVEGQWGLVGIGYGTSTVRRVCAVLLAACDQAEALVPGGPDA